MNYAAKIIDGVVVDVIVGDAYWASTKRGGFWVDSNKKIGVGWTFSAKDGFKPPKPFSSWVWNTNKEMWVSPVDKPDDENNYVWSEEQKVWLVDSEE